MAPSGGDSHLQQAQSEIAVYLSPRAFRALWCTLVLVRAACAVFLAMNARLYWFVAHPYMSYYADLLSPTARQQFKPFGVVFGLAATTHALRLLQMLYYSLRLGRFVLDAGRATARVSAAADTTSIAPNDEVALGPTPCNSVHVPKQGRTRMSSKSIRRVSEIIVPEVVQQNARRGWTTLFARRGFFGVESDFFHARFLVREVIEYVSQTILVYKSSILIAKPWINNLYVALMVTNCWSTPLLQRAFAHSPAVERFLCLVVDLVLDASASIAIPLLIFAPYYHNFDLATYNFRLEDLYDDLWFANMAKENQQLFALSVVDFLLKIVPHVSIYSCLASITLLVKQRASVPSTVQIHSKRSIASVKSTGSDTSDTSDKNEYGDAVAPAVVWTKQPAAAPIGTLSPSLSLPLPPPGNRLGRWGMLVSHISLFTWGLAILVLHLHATKTSTSLHVPACKQPIRPWFATKYACSVLNYNCHRNGSTGVRDDALDFLHEESLVALVFSHCPSLTVPKSIRRFRNLLGIDIFNSTLVEWAADASITREHHPSLAYIIFARVNMTALPPGVLQPLPDSAADFEIAVSNLTALPIDLHERWFPMALLYVEHTLISEFPSTLRALRVDDLSLVGNRIEALPDFAGNNDTAKFVSLALSHNPLTALPASLGDTTDLGFLSIEGTRVTAFPNWMSSVRKSATTIHAFDTPFCRGLSEIERTRDFGPTAVLTCSDTNARRGGRYPLALMTPKRPW